MKKNKIPNIKKSVESFLLSEEGEISKKSIVKAGLVLLLISVASASQINEASALGHTSYGIHTSAGSTNTHCSHGSHGSHGSHSSGCGGPFGCKCCW